MQAPPSAKFSTGELPVLKKATEAYKAWHKALPRLPKLARYTLGERIDRLFIEILELMLAAGYAPPAQKLPAVRSASCKLDTLKFLLQLAWEMKMLQRSEYLATSEPLADVGKMLGGWHKQLSRS